VTGRTSWKSKVVPLLPSDLALVDAFTLPAFRGRGVYPFLLASAVRDLAVGCLRAFGYVNEWNHPSVRGLERAGFQRALAYEVYELGRSEIVIWKRVRRGR
jgi:GNAT superfamily N-acetyltransferase